jgi:hypothetical protein
MRVGVLGWVGSHSAAGARALRRIREHHEANGRTVAFVRPTTALETMTAFGNRRLRRTATLAPVDLLHVFSGGSLVMWHLRDQVGDATAVVFDSGPFVPSARMTAAYLHEAARVPVPPWVAPAIQRAWDLTGYGAIYGCSSDLPRVYRRFIADLVARRATLVIRGHRDPMLDAYPDAADAIAACGAPIEQLRFDSPHLLHLRTHPDAYEAALRALVARRGARGA